MKLTKLRGSIRISAKVNGRIKRQTYTGVSAKNAIAMFFTQYGVRAALKEV